MDATLADALKQFETLITRPAESFADPDQRLAEFHQRLERTHRLIEALGNPQRTYDSIHIAGTSGKGSVAMMCEAVLQASGRHIGTHTSPYLQTPLEKVRVDGKLIAEEDAIRLTDRVMEAATRTQEQFPELGNPQYAEAWLGMALRHFADVECEVSVIEVGMGGRYDATNVITPCVSVINTIHYDHVRVLGDTLAEIAHHKAGIIKPGVPVIAGEVLPEAMEVIEAEAAHQNAPLIRVGRDVTYSPGEITRRGGTFSYRGLHLALDDVPVSLAGAHQIGNAVTALAALEVLAERNSHPLTETAIHAGLSHVRFAGRIEVMQNEPTVVLDGAHNEEKIGALTAALRNVFEAERVILVVGLLETKNAEPIVRMLNAASDTIITTAPQVKGKPAISAEGLADMARAAGAKRVTTEPQPLKALQAAISMAGKDDLIVVTGSLYLIGEMRSYWYREDDIIAHQTMFPNGR